MSFIVDIIVRSVVRAITYAIVISVSTTIRNSIRNSISKNLINKIERFIGADGEIDEEKINSLIKVNVYAMGSGLYSVKIDEEVFDILHMEIISTKDTDHLLKLIKKEILTKKLKAKMRKDKESIPIIEALEQGFK